MQLDSSNANSTALQSKYCTYNFAPLLSLFPSILVSITYKLISGHQTEVYPRFAVDFGIKRTL